MNTYLNPYSLQGFAEAASGTVVTKQGTDLVFQSSGSVQSDYTQMDSTAPDYIKNAPIVRVYRDVTYTASTTSPRYSARFDVSDSTITAYTDGMVVCIKLSGATSSNYKNAFQINSLGYKAIVYNVNSDISNRYSSGSVVWAVYNEQQTAQLYLGSSTLQTVTGCWQVMDYNANTSSNDYLAYRIRTEDGSRITTGTTGGYRIMFSTPDNVSWVPSNTDTSLNKNTLKSVNQSPINPFGRIAYRISTDVVNSGSIIECLTVWDQYTLQLGYSFNRTGSQISLTQHSPVYVKCQPQDDGSAVIDPNEPYVQSLPSTRDGKVYIYIGTAYGGDFVQLEYNNPVYYHDGNGIRLWTGSVSGVNLVDLT